MVYLRSIQLLVILQSKNVSTFNPRQPRLNLETTQTRDRMHRITHPQPPHKERRSCWIQVRLRLRVPTKTFDHSETPHLCTSQHSALEILQSCGFATESRNPLLVHQRNLATLNVKRVFAIGTSLAVKEEDCNEVETVLLETIDESLNQFLSKTGTEQFNFIIVNITHKLQANHFTEKLQSGK